MIHVNLKYECGHVCCMRLYRVRSCYGQRMLVVFLVGVILGYAVVSRLIARRNLPGNASSLVARVTNRSRTLLIAVVTANRHLQSRVQAVRETWGRVATEAGVAVLFYTGEEPSNVSVGEFPIVHLPGVDDSYPPQKKVFKMLQHAQANYMGNYHWLLRADDDVYVRIEQLVNFLNTIDHQRLIYMGQPGIGKPEDVERLKLYPHEHFCMGGPGVLFSNILLAKLVHHLNYCLQHVVSYNEDVEVGRCVSRQLGVQCTWAYDVRWHQDHTVECR